MDVIGLVESFGVASFIGAWVILFLAKGARVHSLTTLLTGVILIALAVSAAATLTNFGAIATALHMRHQFGDGALDASLRVKDLWLLLYPALVGSIGANYLTAWFQSEKAATKKIAPDDLIVALLAAHSAGNLDAKRGRQPRKQIAWRQSVHCAPTQARRRFRIRKVRAAATNYNDMSRRLNALRE